MEMLTFKEHWYEYEALTRKCLQVIGQLRTRTEHNEFINS